MARGRKNADDALLMALACGATVDHAAHSAGVSARTAHRRLKEEGFQKRLQDVRADMVQRTVGMLTASGMEASKTLISLLESTVPQAVRLGAVRTILEFGIKLREIDELAQRIAALEAKVGATERPSAA